MLPYFVRNQNTQSTGSISFCRTITRRIFKLSKLPGPAFGIVWRRSILSQSFQVVWRMFSVFGIIGRYHVLNLITTIGVLNTDERVHAHRIVQAIFAPGKMSVFCLSGRKKFYREGPLMLGYPGHSTLSCWVGSSAFVSRLWFRGKTWMTFRSSKHHTQAVMFFWLLPE